MKSCNKEEICKNSLSRTYKAMAATLSILRCSLKGITAADLNVSQPEAVTDPALVIKQRTSWFLSIQTTKDDKRLLQGLFTSNMQAALCTCVCVRCE